MNIMQALEKTTEMAAALGKAGYHIESIDIENLTVEPDRTPDFWPSIHIDRPLSEGNAVGLHAMEMIAQDAIQDKEFPDEEEAILRTIYCSESEYCGVCFTAIHPEDEAPQETE